MLDFARPCAHVIVHKLLYSLHEFSLIDWPGKADPGHRSWKSGVHSGATPDGRSMLAVLLAFVQGTSLNDALLLRLEPRMRARGVATPVPSDNTRS